MHIEEEVMREGFTKYHLRGLPADAVIHRISEIDAPDLIHDHPFPFRSHVIIGSYVERVWRKLGDYYFSQDIHRTEGSSHWVHAEHIHQIIALPDEVCHTLILPKRWERKWGFWTFDLVDEMVGAHKGTFHEVSNQ